MGLSQELQAAAVADPSSEEGPVFEVEIVSDMTSYYKSHPSTHLRELNSTVVFSFGERVDGKQNEDFLSNFGRLSVSLLLTATR